MRRLSTALLVMCLLGALTGHAVMAQSPSASPVAPGPPYPDPIDGVHVYDYAGVLNDDTIASVEATIRAIEERSGAQVVVYNQVKPESDTFEEAERDAIALIDQWGVGRADIDDGLAILLDLEPNLCHGQVQLYAAPGYAAAYLSNEERQAIFEQDMLPALRDCDIDAALLAAMERIDAATRRDAFVGVGQRVEVPEAGIAVMLPDDWEVDVEFRRADPPPDEAMPDEERWKVLVAGSPDEFDGCRLFLYKTSGLTLDEFAARLHPLGTDHPGMTTISLPVGDAVRLDYDVGEPPTTAVEQYVFGAGDAIFLLACLRGEGPPDDDWPSIAESFEFLPAESPGPTGE